MRTVKALAVLAAFALAVLPTIVVGRKPARKPATKPAATRPAITHTVRDIEGWTVHIDNRLLTTRKSLGDRVLKLLGVKLYDINRVVPAGALAELHKVPIWLHVENKPHACAAYHPSAKWLADHGLNPKMARSVEIANAETFIKWSLSQPFMVLHELAHAYHHRVLGHGHAQIKAAFKQAVQGKSYESVLRYNGTTGKHYALSNDKEYFAEATEAFFGTNDFYPFVHAELLKHDPRMHNLLKKLWSR